MPKYDNKNLSVDEIKTRLGKQSSISEWKLEINRILSGVRDGYLSNIVGNIKEYIEDEILPPETAEYRELRSQMLDDFKKALEIVINEWNPQIQREKEYFASILELIKVYKAEGGIEKAHEFLKRWEFDLEEIISLGGYNSEENLNLGQSAFEIIAEWFSSPVSFNNKDSVDPNFKNLLCFRAFTKSCFLSKSFVIAPK